jgi:hypothetical protein
MSALLMRGLMQTRIERETVPERPSMGDRKNMSPQVANAKLKKSWASPARRLSPDLEKRLTAYAAAGAAGAFLLAAAPNAEAKVVYTPANISIGLGVTYNLDINHDGSVDFVFFDDGSEFNQLFGVSPQNNSNAVVNEGFCYSSNLLPREAPAALPAGQPIGKPLKFTAYGQCMRSFFYYDTQGHWQHVIDKYLGLAMKIDGHIHYGWARLSTKGVRNFQALLTGYAYETEAGKSIVAGDEGQGAPEVESSEAPMEPMEPGIALGELALGAARPSR